MLLRRKKLEEAGWHIEVSDSGDVEIHPARSDPRLAEGLVNLLTKVGACKLRDAENLMNEVITKVQAIHIIQMAE